MPLEAPDFVGIGEKPARQDGQRAVEVVGVVSLGTLPAGTTEAQVDDMMMVLEVADEATPAPNPVTTRTASQLQSLLYNIGVFSLSHTCDKSSPSTERCERRASRASDSKDPRWWIVHHSISRDIPGAVSRCCLCRFRVLHVTTAPGLRASMGAKAVDTWC